MILAGDIGGTKTYLGHFTIRDEKPFTEEIESFRTLSYSGLEPMVREFLGGRNDIEVASFGIPGPVLNERVEVTNVPWQLDAVHLARDLEIPSVHLLNDLVATGYGTHLLSSDELFMLNEGRSLPSRTQALIAAGTGLQCILRWNGSRHTVFPYEAGHAAFAPHDALQADLLRYIMRRYPYVRLERILSGPGLALIYEFLRESDHALEDPRVVEEMKDGDVAAVIASQAEVNGDELCCLAMDTFVAAYGSEAGNLALRSMALGGIYLGGGVAPKIRTRITRYSCVPARMSLGIAACRQRKRVRFTTAAALVNQLVEAQREQSLTRMLARWSRVELIVIDELGYVPLAEVAAELLFQVIAERAEKAAIIVTTNLPFSEWPQVFTNARLCKAVLDRLTDQAHIIETGSESYRFRRTLGKKRKE